MMKSIVTVKNNFGATLKPCWIEARLLVGARGFKFENIEMAAVVGCCDAPTPSTAPSPPPLPPGRFWGNANLTVWVRNP